MPSAPSRPAEHRDLRRLPVVSEGTAVGIVSLGDLAPAKDPTSGLADISDAPPNR